MTSAGPRPARRPEPTAALSGSELRRWYWLKSELVGLARELGVSTAGAKVDLTARVAAALDGDAGPETRARPVPRPAPLTAPLTDDTVLPEGQQCTQQLRAYLVGRIGPTFRFDQHMRSFVAGGAGRTLGEVIDHWHATRSTPPTEIAPQFELNRFLRDWHAQHPDTSHAEALTAWHAHRSLPREER